MMTIEAQLDRLAALSQGLGDTTAIGTVDTPLPIAPQLVPHDDDDVEDSWLTIDRLAEDAVAAGASDIHITPDNLVCFTISGRVVRQPQYGIVSSSRCQNMALGMLTHVNETAFVEDLELDTSYVVVSGAARGRRLRVNLGKSFGVPFVTLRVVNDVIPSMAEIGAGGEVESWMHLPSGLILVNGPTGAGKSTTLASAVEMIRRARPHRIITLEKPIEYVFRNTDGAALVTQREVGRDARSFAAAIDSAMRQAPDVLVVGEVRNQAEFSELLRAAETGHLALSTMHTNSASATLNRIKALYDGAEQRRVLDTLSTSARGFANQVLVPTRSGTRIAVREVLTVDDEIADLLRAGDARGLRRHQEARGRTMEHALMRAVDSGQCAYETARLHSPHPIYMDRLRGRR